MDDLEDAACAVAWKKRSKNRLRELQVADEQQTDAEDAEGDGARPVRQELQREVEEEAGKVCCLIQLFQGVGNTEHEDELRQHQQQKPTLDLEPRCQPP